MNQTSISQSIYPFAIPTLVLITQVREMRQMPQIKHLRDQLRIELQLFDQQMEQTAISNTLRQLALYCLCTFIDEVILNCAWSKHCDWHQQTLLSQLFQDTRGGERFYQILERAMHEPRQFHPLLQLMYCLLALGYQGQLYNQPIAFQNEVRLRVLQTLKQQHGKRSRALSTPWHDEPNWQQQHRQRRHIGWILIGATALVGAILLSTNIKLLNDYQPIKHELQHIGQLSPISVYEALAR